MCLGAIMDPRSCPQCNKVHTITRLAHMARERARAPQRLDDAVCGDSRRDNLCCFIAQYPVALAALPVNLTDYVAL